MSFCLNKKCSSFNCNIVLKGKYCLYCGMPNQNVELIDEAPFDYLSLDFEAEVDKLTCPVSDDLISKAVAEEFKELVNATNSIIPSSPGYDDTIAFIDKQIELRFKKKQKVDFNFDDNVQAIVIPKRINNNFTQILNSDNIGLQMQFIEAGSYLMGTDDSNILTEAPTRIVQIPAFYVSTYLITQLQYYAITNTNPAKFVNFSSPVEQVSFFDAIEYCRILKSKTGKNFRLLSEAEWEYACKAGTDTVYNFGDEITPSLCCYSPISQKLNRQYSPIPVGQYIPNNFGLYDMHGNVWEWCLDNWHRDYKNAPLDHHPRLSNDIYSARIIRGGAWNEPDTRCRSASRDRVEPQIVCNNIGFRVACDI